MLPSITEALKSTIPFLQINLPGFFAALDQFYACHVGNFAHADGTEVRWLSYILGYSSGTLHETCIVDAVADAKTVAQFMGYGPRETGEPQALQRFWCVFLLDRGRRIHSCPQGRRQSVGHHTCRVAYVLLGT